MIATWHKSLGTMEAIEDCSGQNLLLPPTATVIRESSHSSNGIFRAASLKILILEDSVMDARLVVHSLTSGLATPFEYRQVATLADAVTLLKRSSESATDEIGLIITDLSLPDSSGFDTFLALSKHAGDVPIVILSGQEDVETAWESVRRGAQDYVVKGAATPETLGRIVRFAIERARRVKAERELDNANNELEIAHTIQRSLYPGSVADLPGFDMAGAAFPAAKACGDYYDFVPISGHRFGIAVGDVCGHGLPAALMMLQVRTCLRLLAKQGVTPVEILTGVNEAVLHDDPDQRIFTSLFFARLNSPAHQLEFASAGHRGYLLKADGSNHILDSTVPVVGLLSSIGVPKVTTVELHSGDILFVPTDGFHEASNASRELYGESRLLDTVQGLRTLSAASIIQNLYSRVRAFTGVLPQQDDMAAIVLKVA